MEEDFFTKRQVAARAQKRVTVPLSNKKRHEIYDNLTTIIKGGGGGGGGVGCSNVRVIGWHDFAVYDL